MPMVNVGVVGVAVYQPLVPVEVCVRFAAVPGKIVPMGVVLVMDVLVRVLHRRVDVEMLMVLADMQPHADGHQCRSDPERA